MEVFIAILIIGTVISFISKSDSSSSGTSASNYSSPSRENKTPPSQKSKQILVKKNGQNKRYRINSYGEIFEDE